MSPLMPRLPGMPPSIPSTPQGVINAARRMLGSGAASPATPAPPPNAAGGRTPVLTAAFFMLEVRGVDMPVKGFFTEVTGLQAEYEVFEYQEGGENGFVHKFRGRAKYPNLVMKRGVTDDKALLAWFAATQAEVKRAEGDITLYSPNLTPMRKWTFQGAFPVKWQGPNLKSSSGEIAIETLEIAHHGFADAPGGGAGAAPGAI